MSEQAVIHDYPSLRAAIKARRQQLGLSQLAVDEIAGVQTGYTGKIEAGIKHLGEVSLPCILGALGIRIAFVPSAASHESSRGCSSRYAEMGRKGAQARREKQGEKRARAVARHAAKVRWNRWRALKAMQAEKAHRAGKERG